jgi:hypothetical protein
LLLPTSSSSATKTKRVGKSHVYFYLSKSDDNIIRPVHISDNVEINYKRLYVSSDREMIEMEFLISVKEPDGFVNDIELVVKIY